jgi:hypothetical protein
MADMTIRHHKLIEDAVNEAIAATVAKVVCTEHGDGQMYERTQVTGTGLLLVLKKELGHSFATRLAYTHDKFDADEFKRQITGRKPE